MKRILTNTFFALCFILTLVSGLVAQQGVPNDSLTEVFPASWVGTWKGELKIYGPNGVKQKLPMQLLIQPLDSLNHYEWSIIYGEDLETGKRAYQLKPVDINKGIWIVDEQNSIALECYLYDNKLFSRYLVMGNLLLVTNEVHFQDNRPDEMIFEVIMGKETPVSITGNEKADGMEIPEVKTYPIGVMQRGILRREEVEFGSPSLKN